MNTKLDYERNASLGFFRNIAILLVYNGHELGIVTQVVAGVTYEVLGRVVP